jgi:hypothetical protein
MTYLRKYYFKVLQMLSSGRERIELILMYFKGQKIQNNAIVILEGN